MSKLSKLRNLLIQKNLSAYFIPSEDAHQSEYTSPSDHRRQFISNFTGSAGWALVTPTQALLWTDGRYYLQAQKQLDHEWTLMKHGMPNVPTWDQWCAEHLPGARIGIDSSLITYESSLSLSAGVEYVYDAVNLVDAVWTDRPAREFNPIYELDVKYCGKLRSDKIAAVREHIQQQKAGGMVVTALDDLAWLFNLRGSDVEMNPVFFGFAVVLSSEVYLYVGYKNVSIDGVIIKDYSCFLSDLKTFGVKMIVSPSCSVAVADALGRDRVMVKKPFLIQMLKAVKNSTELNGFKNCHVRDGVALCRYFCWLENQLISNCHLDEVSASDKLEEFRKCGGYYKGLSFETISGSGPNGSIIHYRADKATARQLSLNEMYLCDSGAQYLDGTTDVTRTMHFGTPTDYEIECFTRVLKGHIAIATLVFPGNISGPQGISFRPAHIPTTLVPGMTLSNEPGYYEDNKFGIRIESLVFVKEAQTKYTAMNEPFYCFETVTMAPIQTKLVNKTLLNRDEVEWLNWYNRMVYEILAPLVDDGTRKWLARETREI